jgi:TPR repeat protein
MASRTGLALLRNARAGDAQAQLALGRVYLTGEHGLGKSHATAYHWLEMAARAGLEEAWREIGGQIPLESLKEPAAALPWYRRAAAAGVANAQRSVGLWLVEQGSMQAAAQAGNAQAGQAPLLEEGLELLGQAGEQGDLRAQEMLGELFLAGRHVPKDRQRARLWLERAAQQGSLRSHAPLLALCAEDRDLEGVERYARPLAEQGDARASYALGMALLGRVPQLPR